MLMEDLFRLVESHSRLHRYQFILCHDLRNRPVQVFFEPEMAVLDSVTVSIAALTRGIFKAIRSVSRVETSISLGKTDDSAGINKTSSKVKPTGKTSCSNMTHLRARLKKNPDRRLGFSCCSIASKQT